MTRAFLGLGGNIGEVQSNIISAIKQLGEGEATNIVAISPLYRTPPWGKTDQPWFINACVEIATNLEPYDLLLLCMEVESTLKRVRHEHWGPRNIDIDILVYEGQEMESQRLTIPHPRMLERAFVLVPLNDIAPQLQIKGKSVSQWLAECDQRDIKYHGALEL